MYHSFGGFFMRSKTHVRGDNTFSLTVDLIQNYAIYSLDLNGHITSWNKGAENIKGWTKDEVLGRYYDFLYTDADKQAGKPEKNLKEALQFGVHEEIGFRVKKDGTLFLADVTMSQIHEEGNGKHTGYVKVVKDVTNQRKLEDAQIDANNLLKHEVERRKKIENALTLSNEELNAFASAASHDLQEPLRMVVSYLQLIERRYGTSLDEDGKEFLDFAVDGATRMKVLINDLVEYSRIDTLGKKLIPTNVEDSLKRALDNNQVLIEENKALISYDKLPTIMSDEVQLTRLFQNLIANAIKFRGNAKPKIQVKVQNKKDEWIFSVADNGRGIEKKYLKDIFVIFKQLGKRSERKGSGIGLALVKKIVSHHGGTIWAESKVGKGTTIYFSIPKVTI